MLVVHSRKWLTNPVRKLSTNKLEKGSMSMLGSEPAGEHMDRQTIGILGATRVGTCVLSYRDPGSTHSIYDYCTVKALYFIGTKSRGLWFEPHWGRQTFSLMIDIHCTKSCEWFCLHIWRMWGRRQLSAKRGTSYGVPWSHWGVLPTAVVWHLLLKLCRIPQPK